MRGHEQKEANFKGVTKWFVGYLVFLALCGVASVLSFMAFVSPHFNAGSSDAIPRQLPSVTPLQDNFHAEADIKSFRRYEEGILNQPGLSLYHPGATRMPIQQAIDELARRGLPSHASGVKGG